MTKLEKLRDQEAFKYIKYLEYNMHSAGLYAIPDFKAGWDKRDAIAKEREARLVEALEYYADDGNWAFTKSDTTNIWRATTILDDSSANDNLTGGKLARQALADHKRMMEGEEVKE